MPNLDTRHSEKVNLFSLLVAEMTGNARYQINQLMASMEREDIKQVMEQLEEYKNNLKEEG